MTLTPAICRYKIVSISILASVKRNGSSLLRTLVEVAQKRLLLKAGGSADPTCRHFVHCAVEIPTQWHQRIVRRPIGWCDIPLIGIRRVCHIGGRLIPPWLRVRYGYVHLDHGIRSDVHIAI